MLAFPSIAHDKLLQLCPPFCDRRDCSPPGSITHGILWARILQWVAMASSPGDFPHPEIKPGSLVIAALQIKVYLWALLLEG